MHSGFFISQTESPRRLHNDWNTKGSKSMTIPHIAIERHDVGLYEWLTLYGQEKLDGDVGESSIFDVWSAAWERYPKVKPLSKSAIVESTWVRFEWLKYENIQKELLNESLNRLLH